MLTVAICEDNAVDALCLRECLEAALQQQNADAELLAFSSGEQLIDYMQGNGVVPVCFLDVHMKGLNGVEVARWIRARDNGSVIVFATSSGEYMAQGWEVGATHYLLKPFTQETVGEALARCLRLVGYRGKYVEIMTNRKPHRVRLAEITHIESKNKHCIVYTSGNEELRLLARLDNMEEMLGDARFLRCHQSYIVNMDFAEGVREGEFILPGGAVPIRRNNRFDIISRYENYCAGRRG